ncbi:hypothetical protein FACS1894158_17200 [Betaproteobacteria bacterium]|nr:hypothetical protein FACS1894158_17200 [Betaproteobacteria bacterium]
MPTSVALGNHFEVFIRDQVSSGRFNNVSEVVRAGLRLLEEREQSVQLELEALRAEIAAGKVSGPSISADEVFDRLEASSSNRLRSAISKLSATTSLPTIPCEASRLAVVDETLDSFEQPITGKVSLFRDLCNTPARTPSIVEITAHGVFRGDLETDPVVHTAPRHVGDYR